MNVFIDESSTEEKTYIFGAIAIENANIFNYRNGINTLREGIIHNPLYYQYLKMNSLKKSFHYTQDHREIKNLFLYLTANFTFEAFIYIYQHDSYSNYKELRIKYIEVLNEFLIKRYDEKIEYCWEKDESLHLTRWPPNITISEKYKSKEPLLAICDYVVGVFRKIYFKEYKIETKDSFLRDYEYVSSKIRFIKDSAIKKPYTRNNPYRV